MSAVLVIEDHPLVAEATATVLSRVTPGITIESSASAADAMRRLDDPAASWFRVFLDLSVPGAYGLSLAYELHGRGLAPSCCVISAFDRADYIEEIRRLEFLGYVVKAAPVATLVAALSAAMRGERSFPQPQEAAAPHMRLTRRQTQVLELVQAGLSSKHIARELSIAVGTVDNQIAAVLQVLHAESRTHAVALAIELGMLRIEPVATAAQRTPKGIKPGG